MNIERRHVGKRLSGLVIHHASGTAYLAGQVAEDPTADVSGQTRQVLALIDSLLAEAGSDKTKILSATIFLPDIGDFAAMNAVWEQLGRAGANARPRDRRGEARRSRVSRRDPGRRGVPGPGLRDRHVAAHRHRQGHRRRDVAARCRVRLQQRGDDARHARDVRPVDGPVLCAGIVHSRARRGLARLGPGRPDVHRFRERRGGHRARPLPSGARPCADGAGREDLARLELAHERAVAAAREAPHRRDVRRARVLLQLRRRGQRGRAQARAPVCARPARRREDPRRSPRSTRSTGARCSR